MTSTTCDSDRSAKEGSRGRFREANVALTSGTALEDKKFDAGFCGQVAVSLGREDKKFDAG